MLKGDNSTYDNFVFCLKEPYHWLWEKLQPNLDNVTANNLRENAEDSLNRGEVPKLPMNYVSRSLLVMFVDIHIFNNYLDYITYFYMTGVRVV